MHCNTYFLFNRIHPIMLLTGMLLYCAVFGVILGRLGDSGKHMLGFFNTLNNVTMKMVHIAMWYVFVY